jgi:AbrB family looped-hinge helix DNA binding protein
MLADRCGVVVMKFVRKVGKKGSITIPVELREALDVQEGDIVEFELVAVVKHTRPANSPRSQRQAPSTGGHPA